MATSAAPMTREQLAALPASYFRAVDDQDVDAILSHFADDAVLTVQTDNAVFSSAAEIRRMFSDF
ncbi:MAG TPA: nuclear transport factor 2 family protein, partial [Gaiellaceae bacterium]|nr:nuclear transport factor 2 family protein [Gaiellaceae bacterium]